MRINKAALLLIVHLMGSPSCSTSYIGFNKNDSIEAAIESEVDYRTLGDAVINKNPAEAIRLYKKALEFNPNDVISLYHIGEAYLFFDGREGALKAVESAIQINPKNPDSWSHLAQIYEYFDEYNSAAQCWRKVIDLSFSKDLEVEKMIRGLYDISGEDYGSMAYVLLTQALMNSGKLEEALSAANEGLHRTNGEKPLLTELIEQIRLEMNSTK